MKTSRSLSFIFLMFFVLCWVRPLPAGQRTIVLPKGTKVAKLGPGHFRFNLPNGQAVELRNFDPGTGSVGFVGVMDPEPPHQPIEGSKGILDMRRLNLADAAKLGPENYVRIDDDVTWLPMNLTFQVSAAAPAEPAQIVSGQPQSQAAPLPGTARSTPLPVAIDRMYAEPILFSERQEPLVLHIDGRRTVAGEVMNRVELIIYCNGIQVRSIWVDIPGEVGPIRRAIPFHRAGIPGVYRVEMKWQGRSCLSDEFPTETLIRFRPRP